MNAKQMPRKNDSPKRTYFSQLRTKNKDFMDLKNLMSEENLQMQKLSELVKQSIEEEQLLSEHLIELEKDNEATFGQKIADKVAEFGGSWTFIIIFFSLLILWIVINVWFLTTRAFDPYPFILLNLILSCLASIQAPIIMMSQNRREEKDRRRARGDFMINLKAEMEVRNLHSKVDLLITEQMQTLFNVQQSQLDMLMKIDKTLSEKKDI
jgi:uncharacterized membrane protein